MYVLKKEELLENLTEAIVKADVLVLKKVATVNGFRKLQLPLRKEELKENVHPLQNPDVQVELKL